MERTLTEHLGVVDRLRRTKKRTQSRLKCLNLFDFTLPDFLDGPTNLFQFGPFFAVSGAIALDLGQPKLEVRLGELPEPTSVAMPKASVNEDRLLSTDKHYVWTPRQLLPMEPKTVAQPVQKRADHQLGLGMLRADARHQPAAAVLRSVIHHPHTFRAGPAALPLPTRAFITTTNQSAQPRHAPASRAPVRRG